MKILDGAELAGYIKAEQARDVRSIWGTKALKPSIVIVQDGQSELNQLYSRLKRTYAEDIGADFEEKTTEPNQMAQMIEALNQDDSVHGIIVQLPLAQPELTETVINTISPLKDVDGLQAGSQYEPATPLAILWLLAGYNIELQGKDVAVVGQGRLVGQPLSDMLEQSGISVRRLDISSQDLEEQLLESDVIITATGQPGLIKSDMIKNGAVVVDAGTASESGVVLGDVDGALFKREDLTITPRRGGVGPLTVCALFSNLLRATRAGGKT